VGVAGQRGRENPRVGLVVGVRLGEAGALHQLCRLGDPHRVVPVHPRQLVVEGIRGVVGVEDLLRLAPPLRGALLEDPERVPVTGLDVVELRLLERRRQRDRRRPGRHPALHRDRADQRGVLGLLDAQRDALPVHRCDTLLAAEQWPDLVEEGERPPHHHAEDDHADDDEQHPSPHARQFECRSALRAIPSPFHGTASTVPVTELRRNRMLCEPDSSAALTTLGLWSMSRMVILVPAVT
jgi:hypothetical protein